MCGIAGALLKKAEDAVPVWGMTRAMRHRGPDDEGYVLIQSGAGRFEERSGEDTHADLHFQTIRASWPSGTDIALAHRRLSIIDLSSAGHQPMPDSKKEFWITYNGEIYNYKEIRSELEGLGVRFFSQTDTEVILEAYKIWGKKCLHKFNGMWAFAIWDPREKILFCSRDRFGVKPFHYTRRNGDFFFASEIKALLELPQVSREVCEEAVYDYLAHALPARGARTFFRDIHSLDAGHCLTAGPDGRFELEKWYSFPQGEGNRPYTKDSAAEFRALFSDAVRLRHRSDVTVGSCLSGGLDSSSIVCVSAAQAKDPLETFSACYEDPACDERAFIQPVLEKSRANSHFIFPQGKDFWEEWPDLTAAQEEPYASTSLYAHWCVMREASRHKVPVLLNGQGGDELLAGYPRYFTNCAIGRMLRGDFGAAPYFFKDPRALGFLGFRLLPPAFHEVLAASQASKAFLRKDFSDRHLKRHSEYLKGRVAAQKNLNASLRSDFFDYILPALLRYEDKNSMRFSVEVRLPFMDYRLVEWVFGFGDEAKIGNGFNKRILRESMKGVLPEKVRLRTDKMGWATPQRTWLAGGESLIKGVFGPSSKSRIASWVHLEKIEEIMKRDPADHKMLWLIVSLEMWLRVFSGKAAPAGSSLPLSV